MIEKCSILNLSTIWVLYTHHTRQIVDINRLLRHEVHHSNRFDMKHSETKSQEA